MQPTDIYLASIETGEVIGVVFATALFALATMFRARVEARSRPLWDAVDGPGLKKGGDA